MLRGDGQTMTVMCIECETTVSQHYKLIDHVYYCPKCADRKRLNNILYDSTQLSKKSFALLYELLGEIYAEDLKAEIDKKEVNP